MCADEKKKKKKKKGGGGGGGFDSRYFNPLLRRVQYDGNTAFGRTAGNEV